MEGRKGRVEKEGKEMNEERKRSYRKSCQG